jgi:cellulose synthase/poly-beta-1,6-N-acetylglucosamine synthase-like glycosyltransferase
MTAGVALGTGLALCTSGICLAGSLYVNAFALAGRKILARSRPQPPRPAFVRFLILIPAHNESLGVQPTIRSAFAQRYPADLFELAVIADNCTDDTAAAAATLGAVVWERQDESCRGKGHALAWALQRAQALSFDLAVVVDADSQMEEHFLAHLNDAYQASCARGEQAIAYQGRYEFEASESGADWIQQLTIASKAAENSYTYAPRSACGLINLLQGNGFAVSRQALERAPFRAFSIVEDAEYAIQLAAAGVRVEFVNEAQVRSRSTRSLQDAAPQRLRWASGTIQLIGRGLPRLLRLSLERRDWKLAEAGVMLLLTSRLIVGYLALFSIGLLLLLPHTLAWSIALLSTVAACLLQALYLWRVLRAPAGAPVPLTALLRLPAYLGLLGISQAGALLGLRRDRWNRTVR